MNIKKILAVSALCALLISGITGCKGKAAPDFREASWGMSKAEVTKLEGDGYLYADDSVIMYMGEMNEQDAEIYYEFRDDSLYEGVCRYVIGDRILDDLIASYADFRDFLSENYYGTPLTDDYRIWLDKDPEYEADPDRLQIYHQRMRYVTEWDNECSTVTLSLDYLDERINYVLTVTEKTA